MTRAHHVNHSYTAERIEKIEKLVAALQARPLARDEVGTILEVGPSGVRKYLIDLRGMYAIDTIVGEDFIRLTTGDEQTFAFLASLKLSTKARQVKKAPAIDASRHIHIMLDDGPNKVRQLRALPQHEPMMAHFFGMARVEARA